MAVWNLYERSQLGGRETKKWTLSPEKDFSVGRNPDCDLVVECQSVEGRHAVLKWSPQLLSFSIWDLNSVNGTYINNRPLSRGKSEELRHNDALRFGHDKEHVFRMEECLDSSHSTTPLTSPSTPAAAVNLSQTVASSGVPNNSSNNNETIPLSKVTHILPSGSAEEDSLNMSSRSDGRRSVDLETAPGLSKTSKLYGQPSWWGEEKEEEGGRGGSKEMQSLQPFKSGPQILRQLDPETTLTKSAVKLSGKDELRMQAISSSLQQPQDVAAASSWVVDFGAASSPRRARTLTSRPRSADPSPNRVAAKREASPRPKRAATPTSGKQRSSSASSPTHQATPPTLAVMKTRQRAATPPIIHPSNSPTHKATPTAMEKRQRAVTPPASRRRPASPARKPPSSPIRRPLAKHAATIHSKTPQNENQPLKTPHSEASKTCSESSDEFICTSQPEVSEQTVATESAAKLKSSSGEEDKLPVNRKLWAKEEVQTPDSLMLASIEAKMRRLSKLALQTARQVTGLKNTIQSGHQIEVKEMDYLSIRSCNPVVTKEEQNLPEWKFCSKDGNSISRNIRVVEKWLHDIEATLKCIRVVGEDTDGETLTDSVDFASDGEVYLDCSEGEQDEHFESQGL